MSADPQVVALPSPSHSIEAEQSVLGGLLLNNQSWQHVSKILTEANFYRDDHRRIYRHIGKLIQKNRPVDMVTLFESIEQSEDKEKTGGLAYLGSLAQNTPSAHNIVRYAEIVRDHAQRRQIAAIGLDMIDGAGAPGADALLLRSEAEQRLNTITQGTGGERSESEMRTWPISLDLEVLAEQEPKAPTSIMEGIPCGYATGTFGHGGAGKSQIELLRAVCIAAGVPFCGFQVTRRRVLFISCEDRADIIHWRLTRICAYLSIDLAGLRGWLEIIDLVGRDSILFAPDPRTGHALTGAYGILADRIRDYASEVLFLDGITDTFGGNENARSEAKRFINALIALIPPNTGALMLIGHVNKATAGGASGEGYSGSTGWHNACRARWYLYAETVEGEDGGPAEKTGKLILELQKSNHGETGAQIEFEWDNDAHLFVGRIKGGTTEFDRRHRDRVERQGILSALQACAESNPPLMVPAAMTGPRTAFHALSQRPEFPDSLRAGKPAVRRFWRQIEALRHMHAIEESAYRRANRHATAQIILTVEGVRQCAI
jgi:hypothetical protein